MSSCKIFIPWSECDRKLKRYFWSCGWALAETKLVREDWAGKFGMFIILARDGYQTRH